METCTTFTSTFYKAFCKDACEVLPEDSSDIRKSVAWLLREIGHRRDFTLRALTRLGKALEISMISGADLVVPALDAHFPLRDESVLPRFMYPLFRRLFDDEGKRLHLDASDKQGEVSFYLLRQALLAFSKATDIPCDKSEEEQVAEFVQRMSPRRLPFEEIGCFPNYSQEEFRKEILPIAHALLRHVFIEDGLLHPMLTQWVTNPVGRHGPGAVFDGSRNREKWNMNISSRIQSDLVKDALGLLPSVEDRDPDEKYLSRLSVVPKDLTKNRLICIETKELMFAQQGLMSVLYDMLSSSLFTRRAIHLFDQGHNFYASRRREFATIDLSDASDLLSKRLCKLLLPKEVYEILTRYRSDGIVLPDGNIMHEYSAMATMGNALCFPVESLIFWAISLAAILAEEIRYQSYRSVAEVLWVLENNPLPLIRRHELYVFGDDIIVPNVYYRAVTDALGWAGMSTNTSKCCHDDSPIRESCGAYWYHGTDLRVVRFKHAELTSTPAYLSVFEQLEDLTDKGFHNLAREIALLVSDVIHSASPDVPIRQGIKGGWIRWNSEYQRLEQRVPSYVNMKRPVTLPGRLGIYAWFTGQATRLLPRGNTQCVEWGRIRSPR